MRSILVCNQPPRSTQPGLPCVDKGNEYQPKGDDALRLERQVSPVPLAQQGACWYWADERARGPGFNLRSGRVIQPEITNAHALRLISRTGKMVLYNLYNLWVLVIFKGSDN